MGRALSLRVRDALEAAARVDGGLPAREASFKQHFRVTVFGRPRAPWRDTYREAMQDAIDWDLAAFDESEGRHYLAVPTDIEVRRVRP